MKEEKKPISFEIPKRQEVDCYIGWLLVDAYLDGIETSVRELMDEPDFKKLFDDLRRHVTRKICGGDVYNIDEIRVKVYRLIED